MKGFLRKKILLLLIFTIFIFPLIPASASQSTRDQLRELERQREAAGQLVSDQQYLLEQTQMEMSAVLAEIRELDQQIINASEALEAIELDLVRTRIRIEEAEEDLIAAQDERDLQTEILRERIRVMHEQGSMGLLEIIFQAENIEDFFSGWEYMRTVVQFDQDLLARLEASEERIASNIDELNTTAVLIQDLQVRELIARAEIERQIEQKGVFLALLYEDEARHSEYLELLQEEAHAINIDFGIVSEIYRAELAEAERLRREEADRIRREEAERRAAEQEARLAELNFGGFAWPVPARTDVSSPFGNRPDPFTGRTEFHSGIDIPAPGGSRINAAEDGYVRYARYSASWGNYIIIDHADGFSTLYAHNSRNRVSEGDRVTRGQHIADVGTTGRSTGNHLHFEVRLNGAHQNPMSYFGGGS